RVTADDVLKKYWGLEVVLKQIADAADFQRQQLKY
ncbi:TPA: dihydrodipicolinate synthase family protein, partial [Escherichia coli]|nr:dihydrodipicolinate synthase family protein [Escherichia coli]